MDVTGQWYYARWLGGSCRLEQGGELNVDTGGKGVIFSEGKLEVLLHCSTDGWWEGPPDSGLRVCRRERYLILQRRKGDKGRFKEVRATSSMCRAACLCYTSSLGSILLKPKKGDPSAPLVPSVEVPSVEEPVCIPEPQCIPEELCPASDVKSPRLESEARSFVSMLKEARQDSASTVQETSEASQESSEWPEPEAEGLPAQPSVAQDPDHPVNLVNSETPSDELPETTSDEKLVKPPQIGAYCLGVTSRGHSPMTNVILLGEPPTMPGSTIASPSREVIETLGTTPETDYPDLDGASDASDVNLGFIEEHEIPAMPVVLVRRGISLDETSELCLSLAASSPPPSPTSPKERIVAEVEDLHTTIHGLFTVPEHAELPDVPCPLQPSKSDASLLHGGSVFFDGSSATWLRDDNDIPQEVSILHREPAVFSECHGELGSFMSANVTLTPVDEEEPEEDPRARANPLVRANKVSGSLSRSS